MNQRFKTYASSARRVGASTALALAGGSALAAPSFAGLTAAVDFSTVVTAVLAIAALIAVALVAKKGAKMVLGMIGR